MYTKASIVAFFASLAAAQLHAPVGEPKGNAITRPLNEVCKHSNPCAVSRATQEQKALTLPQIVPKCEPFTITWEPTTPNTVSVLLLKGPATNVVKFGPSLAEGIPNGGSLKWTPASDLEVTPGPNGYGLQIIDDVTGQYQYSTQFGISKGNCEDKPAESSPAAAPAPAKPSAPAALPEHETKPANEYPAEAPVSSEAPAYHVPQSSKVAYPTVAPYPTTVAVHTSGAVPPMGTATGVAYSTGVLPTGAMPTSNVTTFTGAASSVKGGLSFAGAIAAFALMF